MRKIHILGGGLAGCTVAHLMSQHGQSCTIWEANRFIGGTCRTEEIGGVNVEFGPHIIYFKDETEKKYWEELCGEIKHKDYFVNASIDGNIFKNSLYDFPCSINNLVRIGASVHQGEVNFENAETFFQTSVGSKAYLRLIRGYNLKQWGVDPSEMDTDWLRNRPITLRLNDKRMFGDLPAGYPVGGYNKVFSEQIKNAETNIGVDILQLMFDDNNSRVVGIKLKDGNEITFGEEDIVINTLPLNKMLGRLSPTSVTWRGVDKVYASVLVGSPMPTYSTTFPNVYGFTRCVDYKQISDSAQVGTALSFAFPRGERTESDTIEFRKSDAELFLKNNDIECAEFTVRSNDCVYPVPSRVNNAAFNQILESSLKIKNLYTTGRLGLFAYISMSNATRKARQLVSCIVNDGDYGKLLTEQREDLW